MGSAHAARLLAAFGGSCAGWTWDGRVMEQDPAAPDGTRCACGHQGLRWLFPWRHADRPGTEIITGSMCVEQVPDLDGASVAGIQAAATRALARATAAEREAADRAAEPEAEELQRQAECLLEARWGYAEREAAAPRDGFLRPETFRAVKYGAEPERRRLARALAHPGARARVRALRRFLDSITPAAPQS